MKTDPEAGALTRAERKKAELRREIIDAAFDCFAEQGYHATGIADIATRLGIGHGTFYRYFENKRDIVDHVIIDLFERLALGLLGDNAPEAVTTLEEYRAQAERIGNALTTVFTEDPRVIRLLFEAPGIDSAMADRVLEFYDLATRINTEYMAHGVELGYLRADLDVENTARAINGMIISGALALLHDPTLDATKINQAIRVVMYDGISAPT